MGDCATQWTLRSVGRKSHTVTGISSAVAPTNQRVTVPIFVVGAPRSGTTMLRLMLNAHPRIAIPFESDFIPKFYRKLGEYGDLTARENIEHLLDDIGKQSFVTRGGLIRDKAAVLARNPRSYSELITAIYETYAEANRKIRWGDKDPDNVIEMDVLWNLFPGCRIVHIVRDGRGVANSLRTLEWGSRNLVKLARDWSWRVTLAHKMGMMLGPGYYHEVRYEDLVRSPEAVLRGICKFVGEPFDREMLAYHKNAGAAMPDSSLKFHSSSIQSPDPAKVAAWQREMSVADRALFEEVAGATLEEFGYPREALRGGWRSGLVRLKYALINRW